MSDDVDDALFIRLFTLRSQARRYTAVDPTAENIVLWIQSHQKDNRESAILAENGPDRRASQIGPKCAQFMFFLLFFMLQPYRYGEGTNYPHHTGGSTGTLPAASTPDM